MTIEYERPKKQRKVGVCDHCSRRFIVYDNNMRERCYCGGLISWILE